MVMVKKTMTFSFLIALALTVFGCKDDPIPRPTGYLRLDYPEAEYAHFENQCPFTFDMNSNAVITQKGNCVFEINYPKMKATVYLSYKPVNNNINLLLRDAQRLTYKHVVKADDIKEQPYLNFDKKVYGMFYDVGGNAATNTQFYVTDSTKHFVAGSVYFYSKPNFDSIMPAVSYLKNDVQNLMQSLRWK